MLAVSARNRPSYAPFAEIDVPFERLVGGRRPLAVTASGSDDMDEYEMAESAVCGLRFALLKLAGRPGMTTLLLLDDDARSIHADGYVAAVAKKLRLPIRHFSWARATPPKAAAIARLRTFRGLLPADFKFDREEANAR